MVGEKEEEEKGNWEEGWESQRRAGIHTECPGFLSKGGHEVGGGGVGGGGGGGGGVGWGCWCW